MIRTRGNTAEIVGALCVCAFGLYVLGLGLTYDIGTLARLGPGLFPVMIGAAIVVLGLALLVAAPGMERMSLQINWRAFGMLTLAVVIFPLVAMHFGFLPAAAATIMLSLGAEPRLRLVTMLAMIVILPLVTYLIFVTGLQVPIGAFDGWQ